MDKETKKSREAAKRMRRKILKSATGEREIGKEEKRIVYCPCKTRYQEIKDFKDELEKRVKIKEDELREVTEERLQNHLQYLKNRFNNILRNEQIRTSAMLREANRDKQEKISALQRQLECANISALMYVVCCERRRKDIEVAALRDEYAAYVEALEQLLADSQIIISKLVRGYRTAGRVDEEWRGKMKAVVGEFTAFVEHFTGVSASHLFDMQLLETKAPVFPETKMEPCEDTEMETESIPEDPESKQWWQRLADHPFLVFGDMSELSPGERLGVVREVRNMAKTPAPEKWREYAFNNISLKDTCSNWEAIKQRYKALSSPHVKRQTQQADIKQSSDTSRRLTSMNVDYRSRMGSILKMITSTGTNSQVPKTSLLAAKDSLEILSVTKLRSRNGRHSNYENEVKLRLRNKIEDLFEEKLEDTYNLEGLSDQEELLREEEEKVENLDEDDDVDFPTLGSMAADSMLVIPNHVPDVDRKISTEKICPEIDCQRARDEFWDSLPPYMKASPATYYEMTYEQYETCTPVKMLYPTKEKMDRITKEFFFEDRIEFNRFKVVEQGERTKQEKPKLTQVNELLKQYPSMCGLFEGTA
ncbi:uncharacterized protein LOC121737915 isoform X2 [Aricia agestis]|uniref:uncharacterized protein LOC121737915 isoform X2 n=1 Tax=Aricia agestis TaxID=91739 RepID=UPI001C2078B2|nr:uncharacterized protein LOC121737915 isoform X2 [Aricia agestis]